MLHMLTSNTIIIIAVYQVVKIATGSKEATQTVNK